MSFKYTSLVLLLSMHALLATPQTEGVSLHRQCHFSHTVPAGNYSGITRLDGDQYALVSDKAGHEGFFVFRIEIDSISGDIVSVANLGFRGAHGSNNDAEGITCLKDRNTLLIASEADSNIKEYTRDGVPTGRILILEKGQGNYGYESLTYDSQTRTLWTCTENALSRDADSLGRSTVIRLQSFDADLRPVAQYPYRLDAPAYKSKAKYYAHGVSEMLAMPDHSLLILEREFHVPKSKIGAHVVCKLYQVRPSEEYRIGKTEAVDEAVLCLPKTLWCEWSSRLTLFDHSLANYEGMCLGPVLADGSQTVILVADSQNRAGGVLKDWFRTVTYRNR